MNRPALPLVAVIAAICIAAIGLSLAAAAIGRGELILVAAVFALGLAQLISMVHSREDQHAVDLQKLEARIHDLEKQLQSSAPPQAARKHQAPSSALAATPKASRSESEDISADKLDFYLEPVIDLGSGRTAHYRGSVGLRLADGARFGMDSVRRGAERAGVASLFEQLTLSRAVPVLRRLRLRGRSASIFVPASAASFASSQFLQRISELLEGEPEAASGLVIEVAEAELAKLSDAGMRGLARLSERGISFCLSGTRGRGPDGPMLLNLGFRYVTLEARLLEGGECAGFVEACRTAGIEIIAGQVDEREMLLGLPDRAQFGYGPLFAAPRMVRPAPDDADSEAMAA